MLVSRTTRTLFLLAAVLFTVRCGSNTPATEETDTTKPPKDVITENDLPTVDQIESDLTIEDVTQDVVLPPGPVLISMYAPTLCGCAANEIPPVNCGWFGGKTTLLRVKATHTAGGYTGVAGIYRIKMMYLGDPESPDGIPVVVTGTPDEFGVFELEFEADTFLPKDSETGDLVNADYPFRMTAVSKVKGDDGKAMEASFDFHLTIDTQGPDLTLVSPDPASESTPKFLESFLVAVLAQDEASGLENASFFFEDTAISSVSGLKGATGIKPISSTLDISEFATQRGEFRVVSEDCVGNSTETTVTVDIIATPKFEMPPKLDSEALQGTLRLMHTVDLDVDDGLNDILVITNSSIGISRTDATDGPGAIQPLLEVAGLEDAQLLDLDGDTFLDLLAMASVAGERRLLFFPQIVDQDGNGTFEFPAEPLESYVLDSRLNLFKTHDMNLDGHPDVVVAGPEDEYSVAVYIHTGKTAEMGAVGKSFYQPRILTGVVGTASFDFAQLNDDAFPDVVLGLEGRSFVTSLINDGTGGFEIAHDTALYGAGSRLVVAKDLDDDGIDDAIMTSTDHKALYVAHGNGYGYFTVLKAMVGQSIEDFGTGHVAQLIEYGMFSSSVRTAGDILSLGSEPDSMVLVNLDDLAEPDIAVALPSDNRIALFMGEPQSGGAFREEYFLQPGINPRAVIAGRFNGDFYNDLACLAGEPPRVVLLFNKGADSPGKFKGPLEIPLPVKRTWTQGRLQPTHFVVRDIDNRPGNEIVVVSEAEKQQFDEDTSLSVPLVLSFLSAGSLPTNVPIKSITSPEIGDAVSGLSAGTLDTQDSCVDLVVTYNGAPQDPCSGRSFDVLRGCRKVISAYSGDDLDGNNADHLIPLQSQQPGHFWALGGFLGLKKPSGVVVGALDLDGLDDVVLFSPESGSAANPESYQINQVASYLTRFNSNWLSTLLGTECPQLYNQTWFRCAPYWPLAQSDGLCGMGLGDEPPVCMPATGDSTCDPIVSAARPSDETDDTETGFDPVAAVMGDFYPDSVGCNDLMIAWRSGQVTYLKAGCANGVYDFHQPSLPPHLFAVGEDPVDLSAGDVNKDGLVDAVTALETNVTVVYGMPGGELMSVPHYLVGLDDGEINPSSVNIADVNEDDLPDILFTVRNKNQLGIYLSGGEGTFFGPVYLPCGATPTDSAMADMDADGCLDVVILNKDSSSVTILRSLRCNN